jgi:hypothetical protein
MAEAEEVEFERSIDSKRAVSGFLIGSLGGLVLAEVANKIFLNLDIEGRLMLDYMSTSFGLGIGPSVAVYLPGRAEQ